MLSHLPHSALHPYGYTPIRAGQLPAGTSPARVIRHDGGSLLVITQDGPLSLRPHPRLEPQPTVGDWLAVRVPPDAGWDAARIDSVLPRTSLLRRATADGTGVQSLAANVDVVLIACGLDRPVRAGRVQRVAAQAWDAGAEPVLVLTKAVRGAAVDLQRLELENPGLRVLLTSAVEHVGLAQVRAVVAGRTAVLIGESGAGKSTLANALLGRDEAAVGAVRERDGKGRHTTTARQLHLLPGNDGGALIDTPGIRAVGLSTDAESVDASFDEIQELAALCRFSDCGHLSEPGCAVLAALADGRLPQARYDSWRRLQREVASAALRSSPHELRKYGKQFARMAKEEAARKRS